MKLVRIDGTELEPTDRPIPVRLTIKVTFSEAPDQTKAEDAFSFSDGTNDVAGTISWSDDGTVMTFTPSADLDPAVSYSLNIAETSYNIAAKATNIKEYSVDFETMVPGDLTGDGVPNLVVGMNDTFIFDLSNLSVDLETTEAIATITDSFPVASAGDMNFDGYEDLLTVGPGLNAGKTAVYIYNGSELTEGTTTDDAFAKIYDTEDASQFGFSAAVLNDIDGDLLPDLMVGAAGAGADPSPGAVYLFNNAALTEDAMVDDAFVKIASDSNPPTLLGLTVIQGDDYNGDSVPDVIFGSMMYVYIFSGAELSESTTFNDALANIMGIIGVGSGTFLTVGGINIGADFDGDGVRDPMFGDPLMGMETGVLYIFSGAGLSGDLLVGDAMTMITGQELNFDNFGNAVITIGDINGDGVTEIAVGALAAEFGAGAVGGVFIFSGADLTTNTPNITNLTVANDSIGQIQGTEVGGEFGNKVLAIGDLDGDGITEIAVTAPFEDNGGIDTDRGTVYIFSGAGLAADLDTSDALAIIKNTTIDDAWFGMFIVCGAQP